MKTSFRSYKILFADDQSDIFEYLAEAVRQQFTQDIHTDIASTSQETIEKIKNEPYDLLVSNYSFNLSSEPEKATVETILSYLKYSESNLPCIVFSGYPYSLESLQAYPNLRSIVKKPKINQLLVEIEKALNLYSVKSKG